MAHHARKDLAPAEPTDLLQCRLISTRQLLLRSDTNSETASLFGIKAELTHCNWHDTSYSAMCYVCNNSAIHLAGIVTSQVGVNQYDIET
jgi:hypothetical protein